MNRTALAPWLFLSPFLLTFGVFTLIPLIDSLFLASHQTFGPDATVYIGLDNFTFMLSDPLFWTALGNTVVFTLAAVVIQVPLALLLALALDRPTLPARGVLRLIFFSPQLVGTVFVAMVFAALFEQRTGLVNTALAGLFAAWNPEFPWLTEYTMAALVIATLWMWVGFNMVLLLAALQTVDKTLMEAATLDGANAWQRFRHVTIPAIRPVLGFVVLTAIIGSAQFFEMAWVLFDESPGPENAGLFIVTYLYQTGFETGDLGYASAIGWMLALMLVAVTMVQRTLDRGAEA